MARVEILDPKTLLTTDSQDELETMRSFSLLPHNRIGWNYPLDYLFILREFERYLSDLRKPIQQLKILDVGCGPGALHGYLEDRFDINIVGIDLHRWEEDYVDIVGDFCSQTLRRDYDLTNIDVIISSSAFEHNRPLSHVKLLKQCVEALDGMSGMLITTSAVTNLATHHYKLSSQWNLSFDDVRLAYGASPHNASEYTEIFERWSGSEMIVKGYLERFPELSSFDPSFLSLGYSGYAAELNPKRGYGLRWLY